MIKVYSGEKIADLKDLTVVDFYADWCMPCKRMGQVLEQIGDLNVLKINVDENEEIAKEYKVMSIPYMLIVKDGEIKEEILGFMPKDDFEEKIKSYK